MLWREPLQGSIGAVSIPHIKRQRNVGLANRLNVFDGTTTQSTIKLYICEIYFLRVE